jgi:hypothetical protein
MHGQISLVRGGAPVFPRRPGGPNYAGERDGLSDEIKCEACDGTGVQMVKQPLEPGKRIYPARCKVCNGKGRVRKATD